MRNMQVQWGNGQFLRPQHFQAQDRYWDEQLRTSEQFDHHFHYGIRELDFDQEALRNQQLQILRLKARMKDGTLVCLEEGQELDRLDLQEAFIRLPQIRVFLAVPKLRSGEANVAPSAGAGLRFRAAVQQVPDESQGGHDHELKFRRLNCCLLIEGQDMSGFETLPLLEIERAGEQAAVPRVKLDAVPPLISCDGWPPLYRSTLRGLFDRIGRRIEILRNQVISHGITLVSEEPLDAERIHMLSYLNMAYARLGVIAFSRGVHPWTAYLELCTIAGMLGIFHPDRRLPAELPRYDHDKPGPLFDYVRKLIEWLLDIIPQPEYEMRYFFGVLKRMESIKDRANGRVKEPYDAPQLVVELKPEWFNTDWEWFVGIHKGSLSDLQCNQIFGSGGGQPAPSAGEIPGFNPQGASGTGSLDWKISTSLDAEQKFHDRAPAMKLVRIPPPRALPKKQDWVYFQVLKNVATDQQLFRQLQAERTLALRFSTDFLANADAERNLKFKVENAQTHYLWQNRKEVSLNVAGISGTVQFCLFAVKKAAAQVGQASSMGNP